MSDVSQGPGWWQASDGKWYPPESAPSTPPQPQGFGAPGGPTGQPETAGNNPVPIGDAFNWGWSKFQQNVGPILIAAAAILVAVLVVEAIVWIGVIGSLAATTTTHTTDLGYTYTTTSGGGGFAVLIGWMVFMIVYFVGLALIQLAIIRATLAVTNGQTFDLKSMFSTDQLGQYILGAILVGVATGIGTMLCLIPGLIVMFFSLFWGFFMIDKKLGAVESIKASFALVNKNVGTLIGFFIASYIAYMVGAILCGIGLLVAIPVVILATGYMYRRLQGEAVAA